MNTTFHPETESKFDRCLTEFLDSLGLSPENREIGLAYLNGSELAMDRIKQEQLRPGDLIRVMMRGAYLTELYREKGQDILARCIQFLWAVGGRSAAGAWDGFGGASFPYSADLDWRAGVIGREAVAVMAGESLVHGTVSQSTLDWIRQNNDILPAALNGSTILGKMFLCAAALYSAPEEALQARFINAVAQTIRYLLDPAPQADVDLLRDYILRGDPELAVPVLSSVNDPATDVPSALRAKNGVSQNIALLSRAAFLAAVSSRGARCILRICTMLNPKAVFDSLLSDFGDDLFFDNFDILIRDMPGGGASALLFYAEQLGRHSKMIQERYRNCTERMKETLSAYLPEAIRYASAHSCLQLMSWNGGTLPPEELRAKLTQCYSDCTDSPERTAAFLVGTGSLSNADRELAGIQRSNHDFWCVNKLLREYVIQMGWDEFACRIAAVHGIVFNGGRMGVVFFTNTKPEEKRLTEMARQLRLHGFPAWNMLTLCDGIYEDTYHEIDITPALHRAAMETASPENLTTLVRASKEGTRFVRSLALDALDALAAEPGSKEAILAAVGDSSKQLREHVARILPKHPEWVGDYKVMLSAKKAATRQIAAEVLGKLGERAALEAALAAEKNTKVADAIRAGLGSVGTQAVGSAAELAAELVGGNKLKKLSWLLSDSLRKVRHADGAAANDDIRNAILLSYCELGRIGRSDTAAELASGLDGSDLEKLAVQVYDIWFAAGAQARQKWVLPFAAVFGGAAMTQRLSKAIHDWPEHQRGAIACDAVMALALSSDPAAIVIVDSISRKFKFRQVKQAAAAALENAAVELGITAEELADRIVPDLGFGKDSKRVFDYGKRSFTVRLTPTLELSITNDQGKTVKSLPAPGKTDDPQAADAYEAFKTMKKQIKTTVTAQRARLESALSVLRCWDTDRWKALFVENPIMHQFAMSLIWGVYENGKLTDTFRYMEDGTFNTVDEDEYTLPENAKIGLVHPVELDDDTLDGWKQQLEDYEIKQSLEQLSRTVHAPEESRAGEKTLEDFGGKMLNSLSLSGKLLQQGWYRGSIVDGGYYDTFYREDASLGIGAELRFSGCSVGYDDGGSVTVYDVIFYTGTIHRGSYVYDTVPEDRILPLGQVPARYYSEIVHQLTRATASSTETEENWKAGR